MSSGSFATQIVPLRLIAERADEAIKRATAEKLADNSVLNGFKATMLTVKALWDEHKLNLNLGFIKSTKNHGNTSVSMGVAKKFFDANPSETQVVVFNCGTGPAKAQIYNRDLKTEIVKLHLEEKDGPMINMIEVANFKPKDAITADSAHIALSEWINALMTKGSLRASSVRVGLVTGKIREHYYSACMGDRKTMDEVINSVFAPLNVQRAEDPSYFLKQESEGYFEYTGTRTMYRNLRNDGLLPDGVDVIGSFGIGRGSCQWTVADAQCHPQVFGFEKGMMDGDELLGMAKALMDEFKRPSSTHFGNLIGSMSLVKTPVIALKSGCAILLEDENAKEFRKWLLDQPVAEPAPAVVHVAEPEPEAKKQEPELTDKERIDRLEQAIMALYESYRELMLTNRVLAARVESLEQGTGRSGKFDIAGVIDSLLNGAEQAKGE